MNKFKAVIFDMDGLMVDSEIYWPEAEKDIWPELGIDFSMEFRNELLGLSRRDAVDFVNKKYNKNISTKILSEMYDKKADEVYGNVSLMPGIEKIIKLLHDNNFVLAIASSSPRRWINLVLDRFKLGDYFTLVCSATEIDGPGKPNPAVYIETLKQLGVNAGETIVFEDSDVGVAAGVASGSHTIAVLDKRWSRGDFSKANLIVDSLENPEVFKYLGL